GVVHARSAERSRIQPEKASQDAYTMPWMIGIDEAGYGPNLGPLVMTAVSCRVPERLLKADFWKVLRTSVRRQVDEDDRRLLIQDSKVVYSTSRGLKDLETGVLATAFLEPCGSGAFLEDCLAWLAPDCLPHVKGEPWYTGKQRIPVEADHARVH